MSNPKPVAAERTYRQFASGTLANCATPGCGTRILSTATHCRDCRRDSAKAAR